MLQGVHTLYGQEPVRTLELVERLRHPDRQAAYEFPEDLAEAADEIEKLRATLKAVQAALNK